jgi:copper transport protein
VIHVNPSLLAGNGADDPVRAVPPALRRLLTALLLAMAGLVLLPLHAGAHAQLLVSTPRSEERLQAAPAGMELLFTRRVALAAGGVELFTGRHQQVPGATARLASGGTSMSVSLPPLTGGDYVAVWTVISADDGHLTLGSVGFSVGPVPPPSSVAALPGSGGGDEPRDWPDMVATWVVLLGLAVAGGGLVAERLLDAGGEVTRALRVPTRRLSVALLSALAGSMVAVAATAGRIHDGGGLTLDVRTWGAAAGVPAGLEAVVGAALLLTALGALVLLRDRAVCLGSVVGAMVLIAIRAHPSSVSAWAEAAIAIHVVVALTWGGSLAHVASVLWRRRRSPGTPELSAMVGRYAHLALLSVLVIVLTGGAAALTQIASAQQLLGTTYGQLLTLKVAVVAWTLLVATVGRRRGFVGGSVDVAAVRDPIRLEVLGLVLVLLITAALANVAPPAHKVASAPGAAAPVAVVIVVLLVAAAVIAGRCQRARTAAALAGRRGDAAGSC